MKKLILILILFTSIVVFASDKPSSIAKIYSYGSGVTSVTDTFKFDAYNMEGFYSLVVIPLIWGGDDGLFATTDSISNLKYTPITKYDANVNLSYSGVTASYTQVFHADSGWTSIIADQTLKNWTSAKPVFKSLTPMVCQGLVISSTIAKSSANDSVKILLILNIH